MPKPKSNPQGKTNEERHGLEPSALTIDYLRRSHKNGSLYSNSSKHNTIYLKVPVPMPDGTNKQITKNSKKFVSLGSSVNNMEILNEYDRKNGREYSADNIKPYDYNI